MVGILAWLIDWSLSALWILIHSISLGYLPLPTTFHQTDAILKKYLGFKSRVNRRAQNKPVGEDFWKEYYDVVKSFGLLWGDSRILNGLPDEEERIPAIMDAGGSGQKDYERSIRDVSWLEEIGTYSRSTSCVRCNKQ
jgi:hypothetical protein